MITGELKNRIDGLWDIFASGGLVNSLDVIEQITYARVKCCSQKECKGFLKNEKLSGRSQHG